MTRLAAAVLLLALLAVASCGDSESPGTTESPDHWSATAAGRREYSPIALPEARNGSRDEWNHRLARRWVINLLADGSVWFKTYTFRFLATDDARERAEVIQALVDALERIKKYGVGGGGTEAPPLKALMLYFDRSCTWRDAADCIRAALTAKVSIDWLQIVVRAPGTDSDHALNLSLSSVEPATDPSLRVHIRRKEDKVTDVQISGRSWAFPAGDDFENAAFLAPVNRLWAQIAKGVTETQEVSVASITVEDGVRWAYVVKLLDILLGLTRPTCLFPADGFALSPLPEGGG